MALYNELRIKIYELKKSRIYTLEDKNIHILSQKQYINDLLMIKYLSEAKFCDNKKIRLLEEAEYSRFLQRKNPKPFDSLKKGPLEISISDIFKKCTTQYVIHLNSYLSDINKKDVLSFLEKYKNNNLASDTTIYKQLLGYSKNNLDMFWYACIYYTMFNSLWEFDKSVYMPEFDSLLLFYAESTFKDVTDILNITMKYGFKSNIAKRQICALLVNEESSHINPLLLYEQGMFLFFSGIYENYLKGILLYFQALANGGTIAAFDCGFGILYYGFVSSTEEYIDMIEPALNNSQSIVYKTHTYETDKEFFNRMEIAIEYFFYGEKYHHAICTNAIGNCLNDIRKYELQYKPEDGHRITESIKKKIYKHYNMKYNHVAPNNPKETLPTFNAMMQVYEKAAKDGNLNALVNIAYNHIKYVKQTIQKNTSNTNSSSESDFGPIISLVKTRTSIIEKNLIKALREGLLSEAATILAHYYSYCEETCIPNEISKLSELIWSAEVIKKKTGKEMSTHEYLQIKTLELYYLGMQNPNDTNDKIECKNKYEEILTQKC